MRGVFFETEWMMEFVKHANLPSFIKFSPIKATCGEGVDLSFELV